jgi:hypothetical protein
LFSFLSTIESVNCVTQLFEMDSAFDMVGTVCPGRESWRSKVRVLRVWNLYSFLKPDTVNSLEMVLIDEKVCSIEVVMYLI